MTMLVRISPDVPCDSYNEFYKSGGWYEVDESTANWCRTRRVNDLTPNAPLVFEVKTKAEAKQVEEEAARVADPSGTPDAPKRLPSKPKEVDDAGDKKDGKTQGQKKDGAGGNQ